MAWGHAQQREVTPVVRRLPQVAYRAANVIAATSLTNSLTVSSWKADYHVFHEWASTHAVGKEEEMSIKRSGYDRTPRAGGVYKALQYPQASRRESRQQNWPGVLFWMLLFVSSVPWAALVLGWEQWNMLPPGVRGSTYLLSVIVAASALNLRLSPEGHSSPASGPDGQRRSVADSGTIYFPSPRDEALAGSSRAGMGSRYAGSARRSRCRSAASAGKLATT